MKPWEFIVESPEDLPVFADLLEEWGHSGAAIVSHLILNTKFPSKKSDSMGGFFPRENYWNWYVMRRHSLPEQASSLGSDVLPFRALMSPGESYFYTATEAIWAVINAGKYLADKEE